MNLKNEIKTLGLKDVKIIAFKTFVFFGLILSVFLVVLYIFSQERYNNQLEKYSAELNYSNELLEISIAHIFNDSIETLNIIKNSNEVGDYLQENSIDNKYEVQQLFVRMAENEAAIDQIRLLDIDGNETVRVNTPPLN